MKFDANLPIYLQIMEEMKRRIVTGTYTCASKIPSVRELAMEFSVNPNTVQRALAEMEREGFLYSERTNGRFVCQDSAKIEKLRDGLIEQELDGFLEKLKQYGCDKERILHCVRERLENGTFH